MAKSYDDNQFSVSLKGIDLSDDQRKRIDKGIKDVVMKEIAGIDNQGDFLINNNVGKSPLLKLYKLPPHTMGIWLERFDNYRVRLTENLKFN